MQRHGTHLLAAAAKRKQRKKQPELSAAEEDLREAFWDNAIRSSPDTMSPNTQARVQAEAAALPPVRPLAQPKGFGRPAKPPKAGPEPEPVRLANEQRVLADTRQTYFDLPLARRRHLALCASLDALLSLLAADIALLDASFTLHCVAKLQALDSKALDGIVAARGGFLVLLHRACVHWQTLVPRDQQAVLQLLDKRQRLLVPENLRGLVTHVVQKTAQLCQRPLVIDWLLRSIDCLADSSSQGACKQLLHDTLATQLAEAKPEQAVQVLQLFSIHSSCLAPVAAAATCLAAGAKEASVEVQPRLSRLLTLQIVTCGHP